MIKGENTAKSKAYNRVIGKKLTKGHVAWTKGGRAYICSCFKSIRTDRGIKFCLGKKRTTFRGEAYFRKIFR